MGKPVIGLTTYNQKNQYGYPITAVMHKYIRAILDAGGGAVLIPSIPDGETIEAILSRLDGVLFTGGGDIDPAAFRGEIHPTMDGVDRDRDQVELDLLAAVIAERKPFLGICRGFQLVNVGLGGSLYTHIMEQLPGAIKHNYHSGTERELLAHEIRTVEGSRMARILEDPLFKVNSLHHQGVKDLAMDLVPAGYAPDGLVEAFELQGHPFGLAVQWHPEWLDKQPTTRRLFTAFVEAAQNHATA